MVAFIIAIQLISQHCIDYCCLRMTKISVLDGDSLPSVNHIIQALRPISAQNLFTPSGLISYYFAFLKIEEKVSLDEQLCEYLQESDLSSLDLSSDRDSTVTNEDTTDKHINMNYYFYFRHELWLPLFV